MFFTISPYDDPPYICCVMENAGIEFGLRLTQAEYLPGALVKSQYMEKTLPNESFQRKRTDIRRTDFLNRALVSDAA